MLSGFVTSISKNAISLSAYNSHLAAMHSLSSCHLLLLLSVLLTQRGCRTSNRSYWRCYQQLDNVCITLMSVRRNGKCLFLNFNRDSAQKKAGGSFVPLMNTYLSSRLLHLHNKLTLWARKKRGKTVLVRNPK